MNGQQAGSLYYDLEINKDKLSGQLKDADKDVNSFGDRVGSMGESMQKGLNAAAKGLAVVGVGLTAYAKNATDFTVDLYKQSKALGTELGVSTTEASRLTAALGRMGIESDKAQQMFGIFAKKIVASTESSTDNRLAFEKLQIDIEKTRNEISKTTDEIAKHGDKTGALNIKLKELNNSLQSQQSQLNANADSFQKLGVSTVDSNGKQKDFNTILFEVADKFKAMPDGIDKTATAIDLFGRSGKEMIKVLDLGSAGIVDLEKQADKLGLTLNENTIVKIQGLVKAQKDLKQQTDEMKIAVGTATAPVLASFDRMLNNIVEHLMATDSPLRAMTTNILAFGGPIASATAGFAGFLGNISSISGTVLRIIGGLTLVAAVIAIIAGVAYIVIQHFGGWHEALKKLQPVFDQIKQWFEDVKKAAGEAFDTIKNHVDDVIKAVELLGTGKYSGGIFGLGKDAVIVQVLEHIHNAFSDIWNIIQIIAPFIATVFVGAFNLLVGVFNFLWPPISALFSALWQNLLPALQQVADAVMRLWNALNPALMDALKVVGAIIGIIFVVAVWIIINALRIFIDVLSFVIKIIADVIGWVANLANWFGNLVSWVGHTMASIIWWFWQLSTSVGNVIIDVINWFRRLPGMITGALGDLGALLVNVGKSIINGLLNGIKTAFEDVKKFVGGIASWIKDHKGPIDYDAKLLTPHGKAILTGFNKGLVQGWRNTQALIEGMTTQLASATISPSVTFGAGGAPGQGNTTRYGDTVVNIGQVNNQQDENYVIRRLDRNSQLEGLGISPTL